MSGHRWNNRFNPPLETASVRFPRAPVELPQVRADRLTHQLPGAPNLILYNDPTTRIPGISLSILSSNVTELTVTLDVSFGYAMTGDDHYEFTFTNSNTGVSTTKRFQQDGNTYTIGEFDPGVNYYVYVTPVINGLVTPSSATQTFLSSPGSAPGILQGVTLTGSGSFAIINFESVFPTSPFPDQIAVDTNFGDEQVLVDVSAGNKQAAIGPYTNGASYQFTLTPVTKTQEGIYRYGTPLGIPAGNNYFIPGPPGTLNVKSIYAIDTTVYINVSFDRVVHPNPDQFRLTSYTSILNATLSTITGVSGQINDLSTPYPAFTVSSGLISAPDYVTLSAGVSSSNLVADITDNNGVWYSFRVSSISSGNVYTFANPTLVKGVVLSGSSFSVNFNTVTLSQLISPVTISSSVASSRTVGGVTTSFNPSGQVFTISPVQTQEHTTFTTEAFANRIFSTVSDYATLFAGPPSRPGYGTGPQIGNQTFRWTVERALTGPRPVYYTFVTTGTTDVVTTQLTATISGLTNGTQYFLTAYGFANAVAGPQTVTLQPISPGFVPPTSLSVVNISDTAVLFNIGRPLGGAYGYVITASSATRTASALFLDSGANIIVANFSTGLFADIYRFDVYTQSNSTLNVPNNLSASAPGVYSLGAPFQPSNVQGVYYGYQANGITRVNLTLTASRGLVSGIGPLVARYNISDNFGNVYTASALPPNGDLGYTFATLSAYVSYSFTITPFGNNTSGTPVTSSIFDFNPQPPASADLFMTGSNGSVMNISFGGPAFSSGQIIDYYSISAVSPLPLGFAFGIGTNPITRINVQESPLQQPAVGVAYRFKVFTTICGITSTGFALTPEVTGGPPIPPTVSYTLGCNTIAFSISVNALNAVRINNYFITEYFRDVSSGLFLPTGTTYTIPVTPSLTPVASYTISGMFTISYSLTANTGTWSETEGTVPRFNIETTSILTDTLALNTYPNLVILTLSQTLSSFTFPVTTFSRTTYSLSYETILTAKRPTVFDTTTPLDFTWRSGTGPFTGGSYRYDFQSLGNETLISTTSTPVIINLYVGAPGTPVAITNNTTVSVTFSAPVSTTVTPEFYVVSDNYGRTVSGATTLSSYVFTNTTTGSAYSYFVTSVAQGISSAPSQLSPVVYPGRPGPPTFQPSFSMLTATISTVVFVGNVANPYIPIADVCLNIQGQPGYQIQKTNIGTSYTVNGPTYRLTNLVPGESYTFSLSAFANQVYSTIASTYNYYVGSIPPNIGNGATVTLNNTTAFVSVSAAIPTSKVGGGNPDTYVFIASLLDNTVVSTTSVPYTEGFTAYTTQFSGLVSLTDYRFSGHTITNGLSFGSSWSDTRSFNAGGPRNFTGPITYTLPAGTPTTRDVSLQITISTGAAGVTGLWADTSYFISVSTGIVSSGSSEFSLLTASSYTVAVSSGNRYYASVYAVKNQVTGNILQGDRFAVLPAPPRSPVISLQSTPDINVTVLNTVPAALQWTPSPTLDISYFYTINGGTFVDNGISTTAISNLVYGGTYSLNVYSQKNELSSGFVTSVSAYVFTNPPTNLRYSRRSTIITLSWGSAFQPQHSSNITYTVSVTSGTSSVSALSIGGGGGGPRVTIGSNIMPAAVYSQFVSALTLFRPIVITLSGLGGITYNASYTVTSIGGVIIQGGIGAYSFSGDGTGLPNYTGSNIVFSITNPSALPTNGYTVRDTVSDTVLGSNIYSNSYSITGILGNTYSLQVQALNSNLYSLGTSASTGVFVLSTNPVTSLSATYFGSNATLTWATPQQFGGDIPTTTPPYSWAIFNASGNTPLAVSGNSPSTQTISPITLTLGLSYTYYIITNYYGISSSPTYANQISLFTSSAASITQNISDNGIVVSWQTALQQVYLPQSPTTLSSLPPNGGYYIADLCGTGLFKTALPTDTSVYFSDLSTSPNFYRNYNFGVTAIHNGVLSSVARSASGAIFFGVNPVTNPTVSINGMVATLTWTPAVVNGTTVPYVIRDINGSLIGDPSTQAFRTISYGSAGIYSFTTLVNESITAAAYGAGGTVGAGGFVSNTYSLAAGTTIVAKVGAAAAGGESTTLYVPDLVNPKLIMDAGGGGGLTVSGEGFFRNDGLPYPDGGPPGQPGYGSGGIAQLGLGSPAGKPGQISISMTTQIFKNAIQTPNTSISFLVLNNTTYTFQIVSYNGILTASASSVALNTTVAQPTNLQTTFLGLALSNIWNIPSVTPESLLLTNLVTGTYDIVTPGSITGQTFSEPGEVGRSYRFSLLAVTNGRPSTQIYSSLISMFSIPPSNFIGDYNGTRINLSASGVVSTPLERFLLTDNSGNVIASNIPQSIVGINATVLFPRLTGSPGVIYNYRLFGITNGLSSVPVSLSLGLTIPGSTSLVQAPLLIGSSPIEIPGPQPTTTRFFIPFLPGTPYTITLGGGGGGGNGGASVGVPSLNTGGAGGVTIVSFKTPFTGPLYIDYTLAGGGAGGVGRVGDAGGYSVASFINANNNQTFLRLIAAGGGGAGFPNYSPGGNAESFGVAVGGRGGLGDNLTPATSGKAGIVFGDRGPLLDFQNLTPPDDGYGRASNGTLSNGGPGSITIAQGNVGQSSLTVYQCIPPADEFRAVSTTLTSNIYTSLCNTNWVGVAMEIDGGTSIAITDSTNGSNIWVTTNQGLTWGNIFTSGLVGASAQYVTIAANGTWGAVTTTSGLWVSSNVSALSPWFYVANTRGSNIISAGFSPNGSTLIVGQSNGYLYYIPSSQLYPENPSPLFTNGLGLSLEVWNGISWSGDGNTVFAINNSGNNNGAVYSITGGVFWNQITEKDVFTSVSANSNGTYVLLGHSGYPRAYRRNTTDYNFVSVFPGTPFGLPSGSTYKCAASYDGAIQTALVTVPISVSAYISYDFGNSWVPDIRITFPSSASTALSSNGLIQTVVGSNTRIRTIVSTAVPSLVSTTIPIGILQESATGYIPQGAIGYQVIPYRKNILGPSVFAWSTPQAGPRVFPQTDGPASFTTPPYASGYDLTGNYVGYFVIDNTFAFTAGSITVSSVFNPGGSPTISTSPIISNAFVLVYSLSRAAGDLYPGNYTYRFTVVSSGLDTTSTITVPLRAPVNLVVTQESTQLYATWTPSGAVDHSFYNIYSNGGLYLNAVTNKHVRIPNNYEPVVFGVQGVFNNICSSITEFTVNYFPPKPVFRPLAIVDLSLITIRWTSNPSTTYNITSALVTNLLSPTTVFSGLTGSSANVTLNIDAPRLFGVQASNGGGFSSFSYVSASNVREWIPPTREATTYNNFNSFILTDIELRGGGGGGGGSHQSSPFGGGGGGQGGFIRATGGTTAFQSGLSIILSPGPGSPPRAVYYGGDGGAGGTVSTLTISGRVVAFAGGGNGGRGTGPGFELNRITYIRPADALPGTTMQNNFSTYINDPQFSVLVNNRYIYWGGAKGNVSSGLSFASVFSVIGASGEYPTQSYGGAGGGRYDGGGGADRQFFGAAGFNGEAVPGGGGGGGGGLPAATGYIGGLGAAGYVSISYVYLVSNYL